MPPPTGLINTSPITPTQGFKSCGLATTASLATSLVIVIDMIVESLVVLVAAVLALAAAPLD